MKTVNRICQVLAIAFGLGSLVLFFTNFATMVAGGNSVTLVGANLAFGSEVKVNGTAVDMARSSQILFCFWLTAISLVLSIFSFKSKKIRYIVPGTALISAIYMLVIALGNPWNFVDTRPLKDVVGEVTNITYGRFVLFAAIALFAFTLFSIAYLLIDDYLEVCASKGNKLTIPKRLIRFFRDYKSEIKKIVWPGFRDVVKNTSIVLIMCLIVGAFIWALDWGLGQLLDLLWRL